MDFLLVSVPLSHQIVVEKFICAVALRGTVEYKIQRDLDLIDVGIRTPREPPQRLGLGLLEFQSLTKIRKPPGPNSVIQSPAFQYRKCRAVRRLP